MRRFSVRIVMVLMVGVAVGLAALRNAMPSFGRQTHCDRLSWWW